MHRSLNVSVSILPESTIADIRDSAAHVTSYYINQPGTKKKQNLKNDVPDPITFNK